MTKDNVFMDDFMSKLKADSFVKDNQPNMGPEINAEFIDEQLSSYVNLLKSGIIERATCKK